MAVKIRLARGGAKKRPFYRIVAADARRSRDGKFIEKLGRYNPLLENDNPERFVIDEERLKYWVGEGAQLTERVAILASKAGLVEAPVIRERPQKSKPKAKAQELAREKAEKAAAAAAAAAEATAEPAEAAEE